MDYNISPLNIVQFSNFKTRALNIENLKLSRVEKYHNPLVAGESISPMTNIFKLLIFFVNDCRNGIGRNSYADI